MAELDKFHVICAIVVITVLGVMFGYFGWTTKERIEAFDATKQALETAGFTILKGRITSPTVIVILDDYEDFLLTCMRLNTTTLYNSAWIFYVFSQDWQEGYSYCPV